MARIEAGERPAEAELVERYGRAVALLLGRHTRSREEAEDLYQDTFRLALEKLRAGELRQPEKLPGFLARIAKNLAIEHYRKIGRRKTEADSEVAHEAVAVPESQLGNLLARERAAQVRRVIGELSTARDRELLLRFYIAEEDKDALAADLGLDNLQLNRVLFRARQRYKALLEARLAAEAARMRAAMLLLTTLVGARWGAILALLVSLSGWEGRIGG